ncbi:hypothetical protein FGO68_gene3215 [Halteria grandinella]|uniref:Uncharacterized protein n=1 Tax=Halteria grandinella TaxID=5974 RepID=A0A8J8NSR9_HALGN|nr:hypothetical protein FGO68_gene3215 [Halteria grandinella]
MMYNLEQKIQSHLRRKRAGGAGNELSQFTRESVAYLGGLRNTLQIATQHYQAMSELKLPKSTQQNEIYFKSDKLLSMPPLQPGQQVTYVGQIHEDLLVFTNKQIQQTDIVQISRSVPQPGTNGMKKIKTFNRAVNFVIQHEDRLIMDDYVYRNVECRGASSLQLVQTLEHGDITGGVGITAQILILGHRNFKTISIWRYDGDRYQFIQKQRMTAHNHYSEFKVWLMRKDLCGSQPNEIMACMGDTGIYRLAVNAKDVSKTTAQEIWANKRDKLVDYKQLDDKRLLCLHFKVLMLVNYKEKKKLQSFKLQEPSLALTLAPNFDLNHHPFVLLSNQSLTYDCTDIQGTGIKGKFNLSHLGIEKFKIISEIKQPPKNWGADLITVGSVNAQDVNSYLLIVDISRIPHQVCIISLSLI